MLPTFVDLVGYRSLRKETRCENNNADRKLLPFFGIQHCTAALMLLLCELTQWLICAVFKYILQKRVLLTDEHIPTLSIYGLVINVHSEYSNFDIPKIECAQKCLFATKRVLKLHCFYFRFKVWIRAITVYVIAWGL